MDTLEKIWLNLSEKLRSFILSKISDQALAEDLLQEVFIRIHENIDTLRDDTKIQSWIYQIARNLINDHFRNLKKDNLSHKDIPESEESSADQKIMEEAVHDMIKMMDELPTEYCEALCLTELEGLSQIDYAQRIGISYSGAKSRVQRSRKLLKDMLMNCCHYEFDKYGTVLNISPNTCCCCHPDRPPC